MTPTFEPFTPELFKQQPGLNAHENEAIYVRWVNTQVNYANYQSMNEMTKSLKEIIRLLNENNLSLTKKEETYPFSK
jgi:ribosomal protein S7